MQGRWTNFDYFIQAMVVASTQRRVRATVLSGSEGSSSLCVSASPPERACLHHYSLF